MTLPQSNTSIYFDAMIMNSSLSIGALVDNEK